ncbi:mitochondrial carrier protein SCaMC-3L-like [Erinaceus europaeus]|uniref:Mitochondrial carrier protein SCaMC-3L-like n=1 Tax=Erinaceus europaeus TaxID=9365 RepID=A0A1S2ZIG4_ERIEU|nr:mitochondrial carrier protein SCaMC-3L-like [Erinaceus europaeus]
MQGASLLLPVQVLKTQLTLGQTGQYTGLGDCACKIWRHELTQAFYRGYLPNMIGIVLYAITELAVYELIHCVWRKPGKDTEEHECLVNLTSFTLPTTCGQISFFPLYPIRTRMQAQESIQGSAPSMRAILGSILTQQGWRGFFRGLGPGLLKVLPACGLRYVTYEAFKKCWATCQGGRVPCGVRVVFRRILGSVGCFTPNLLKVLSM